MGLMKRFSYIFKSKASKALDKYEDPRETLDYSYEKQLELLQKMKRGVADVATSRKRIELQAQQLQSAATKLEGQAKQAIAQNREDLAREALARRSGIASQLQDLQAQHDQLKVEAFRTRKETIKATYTAAEAQTKVGEAISGISEEMGDVGMAMSRAEDKVAQMQARSGALDELSAGGDRLQAELNRADDDSQVELELARLKGELGGTETKQLGAPTPTPTEEQR